MWGRTSGVGVSLQCKFAMDCNGFANSQWTRALLKLSGYLFFFLDTAWWHGALLIVVVLKMNLQKGGKLSFIHGEWAIVGAKGWGLGCCSKW